MVTLVVQRDVEAVPCITNGQFRQLAEQRRWTFEWLLEQVAGEIDKPAEQLRRVMHGALVDGKHQLRADVAIPFRCLIELYGGATHPKPALAGEKACACECGGLVRGKRKWSTSGCRKRVQRGAVTAQKVALASM